MKKQKSNFDYQDLYSLINSLSKPEKRFFSINSSHYFKKNKSNLLKIFKIFVHNSNKSIESIETKIKNMHSITALTETKYQLFYSIFKNLHYYHINNSPETEIQTFIHYIEIAYNKSLYSIAEKLLQRAWEKAESYEVFPLLLILLQWKKKLYQINNPNAIKDIVEQELVIIKQLENLSKYNRIKQDIRPFISNYGGYVKDKAEEKKLRELYRSSGILENEKYALSLSALCQYHLIKSAYYFCLKDLEGSFKHTKLLLDTLQENSKIKSLSEDMYIHILHNAIILSYRLRKFDETKLLIMQMQAFKSKKKVLTDKKEIWMASNKISLSISLGDIDESLQNIKRHEEVFNKCIPKDALWEEWAVLAYKIAYVYFIAERHRNCLIWLNKILKEKHLIRYDIIIYAHILFLITIFEQKKEDYLPYVIVNTYRVLRKKQQLAKAHSCLLKYLRKNLSSNSKEEIIKTFENLKNELVLIYQEAPLERQIEGYFDLVCWLTSKIKGISFRKALQEKEFDC